MFIRLAGINESEIERINEIYNDSVSRRFLTADTEPTTLSDRIRWLLSYNQTENPVYVAVEDFSVVGWISVRPYREGRSALKSTKEISYYVAKEHQGKLVGSRLLQHVIAEAPQLRIKNLLAIVLESNAASIRLLEKFQFKQWGHLPAVAEFNGQSVGHLYYGLHLENVSLPPMGFEHQNEIPTYEY